MYKVRVPGQRAEGQKQVIVVFKEDFLETIDDNLGSMGFGDRSQFIRTAVLEKLARAGVEVQPVQAAPPQRTGKGGRPKKVVEIPKKDLKVAEDEGPPPPEASAPRKAVKYPKKGK